MNKNFIFRMLKKNKAAFISLNVICLFFITLLVGLCFMAISMPSDPNSKVIIPNWVLFPMAFFASGVLTWLMNDTTIKSIKKSRIERNEKFKIIRKFRELGVDLMSAEFANFINNSDVSTLNAVLNAMHNSISHRGEN